MKITAITVGGVVQGKTVPPDLAAYIVEQAEAFLAASPSNTAAALAKRLGVSGATVSTLLSDKRGVGWGTARGMAHHLGISLEELERRAAERWKERLATEAPPELTLERPERYPNRVVALEQLGDEIDPETARRARGIHMSSPGDLSVSGWSSWILTLDREVRRELAEEARQRAKAEAKAKPEAGAPGKPERKKRG